jgi:lipopolysaccharide transport system permease protein
MATTEILERHSRCVIHPIDPGGEVPDIPITIIEPSLRVAAGRLAGTGRLPRPVPFLVWREIKVRYAQSAIGIGWAVIQPVFSMLIFTIVFGKLAGISSDGAPYALFSLAALVPWTYFSNALVDGANCLVGNANMLSKVYFPRMLMPLAAVAAKLVDFTIAMTLLAGLMLWYGQAPTWGVLMLPLLILLMILTAAGLGMWLTALAVQYRDVKHAMNFVVQLLMYAAPVVYPASLVPERFQLLLRPESNGRA